MVSADPALVQEICREVLGEEPRRVIRLAGRTNRVYEVRMGRGGFIARLNANAAFLAGTAANIVAVGAAGVPVPTVVASDVTMQRYPAAYVLLEKIVGSDLRDALGSLSPLALTALAGQVAACQRAVATLPMGRGFGQAVIGASGHFPSWPALVEYCLHTRLRAVGHLVPAPVQGRIRRLVETNAPYFARVAATCFLEDAAVNNVIVRRGRLAGIIDLDVLGYGDPLFALADSIVAGYYLAGAVGLRYGEALSGAWPLEDDQTPPLHAYLALHALDFARGAHEANNHAACAALVAGLERLVNTGRWSLG